MLKFVRQGETGQCTQDELTELSMAAVTESKERAHDCNVCKTRRRSLDRQKAQVLRRSRSRETLQSNSTGSSTNYDGNYKQPQSQTVTGMQEGGRGVWCAKGDKYRRMSRSCEALSSRNKSTFRQNEDADENMYLSKKGLKMIRSGKTKHIDCDSVIPTSKDSLKKIDFNIREEHLSMHKAKNTKRSTPFLSRESTDFKTRHMSCKDAEYIHNVCHENEQMNRGSLSRPSRSVREGAASQVKQVQFAGVEYEKSKEASVMGKLKNVVSNRRRKLRSRSLERIDHREEWNREFDHRKSENNSWITRIGRSRSKIWVENGNELMMNRSHRTESDLVRKNETDYGKQQLMNTHNRRSRSRSRECTDRTQDESETRMDQKDLYSYDGNQNIVLSEPIHSSSKSVNFNKTRKLSSCDHRQILSDDTLFTHQRTNDSKHNTPDTAENTPNCSGTQRVTTNYHLHSQEPWQEPSVLISPHYVAPNGHYGNAVVRKCHGEQEQTIDRKQSSKSTQKKALKFETASKRGDGVSSSRQHTSQLNETLTSKDTVSVHKLDKCGISAKKIAKLDSPIKLKVPRVSVISDIIEAPSISVMHSKDESTSNHLGNRSTELTPPIISRSEITENLDMAANHQPRSSGYVYNCTTAKITKLSHGNQSSKQSGPQKQNDLCLTPGTTSANGKTHLDSLPGNVRRHEPAANSLIRHASVASLSLISINSGTSCHEDSTTDSSDKETEVHAKSSVPKKSNSGTTRKQLGREARKYTTSAKELENLILGSCFGMNKHGAALVTSDYESDTGPDMVRSNVAEDSKRKKGGVSRVVRFVGGKHETDLSKDLQTKNQELKSGQMAQNSLKNPATNTKLKCLEQSVNNHLSTKFTTRAHVLNNHKSLSKAEMSVHQGDIVYLSREEFEQCPLWVMAYSVSRKQIGLIPSVYLATSKV